ncbi:hypothetical protein R3X28_05730 [Maribacter sp. TH_r10]|uniref:hypothetical protein n=1 Tax=Maribacter sp. TH_r10 TaxID=3082086 RepID=UPI002955C640|nr:hypothetical protein [Maribacter sp. TH_r10]MDV7138364.1 hypothetical protein [Maribacter sp. TH_r10]
MKKLILSMVLVILGTMMLSAQRGSRGWGQNSNYGRMYNPKTVETIVGTVTAIERRVQDTKMSQGLFLTVKTETETISVHLGPTWYMDNQDIQFQKGDEIRITGSRITFENAPAIIVKEVEKNDNILKLRDNNGFPIWSGWRKKNTGKRMINR